MIKKLCLALILAMASSGVWAEWEDVGSSQQATLYVNQATVRKSGTTVKMWILMNFKKRINLGGTTTAYWSTKIQNEYDCNTEKYRRLYFSNYAEKMGYGEVIFTDNSVDDWRPISPDSVTELAWRVACRMP